MAATGSGSRRIIRYALIDLSGTLHVGSRAIDGAVEAIQRLYASTCPIKVLFLTNTTTVSRATLIQSLHDMGFSMIQPNDIMTSAQAVQHYVLQHNLHPLCLVEPDLRSDLPFSTGESSTPDDTSQPPSCDSVLVGLSPSSFQYETLNQAFRILKKHKPTNNTADDDDDTGTSEPHRLLCFHRSKHVRSEDGELSLGPGAFVACLEHTTNHTAHVLGKPSRSFFQAALAHLSPVDNNNNTTTNKNMLDGVVMVGDDVVNDVMGAHHANIGHLILVQTGKYEAGDEKQYVGNAEQSLLMVPSIVQAVDYILEHAG